MSLAMSLFALLYKLLRSRMISASFSFWSNPNNATNMRFLIHLYAVVTDWNINRTPYS